MNKQLQDHHPVIDDGELNLVKNLEPFVDQVGGLLRALRWMMCNQGFIDTQNLPTIAKVFNLSQAEIRGVISFYHDFKTKPPPVHTVRVCQAEACQAVGSRELTRELEKRLNIQIGSHSEDNFVSLEPVYCLGLCALGPSMEIDQRIIAKATVDHLESISR